MGVDSKLTSFCREVSLYQYNVKGKYNLEYDLKMLCNSPLRVKIDRWINDKNEYRFNTGQWII
jgi:hypothetical protein